MGGVDTLNTHDSGFFKSKGAMLLLDLTRPEELTFPGEGSILHDAGAYALVPYGLAVSPSADAVAVHSAPGLSSSPLFFEHPATEQPFSAELLLGKFL